VATTLIAQFRYMGSVVGVAIVTCILNSYMVSHLSEILTPAQIDAVLQSTEVVGTLPGELRHAVQMLFAKGYNLQMRVLIGFSAAQIPAALLMWQKNQVVLGT